MHLDGLLAAATVHHSARPAALHFHTVVTVEAVTALTLEREGSDDEFAQPAHEHVDCGTRPRGFVDLIGTRTSHLYLLTDVIEYYNLINYNQIVN